MKDWKNIRISEGDAGKGTGKQIDAELPSGEPVRILITNAGRHVAIGKDAIKAGVPPAVDNATAWEIIRKAGG